MCAADTVLKVPIQCEYYALEGLSQLMNTVELVRDRLNPNLEIEGVVFTMYDARTNLSLQVVENVKANLDQEIYKTIIPRNVRLAEALSYGIPITNTMQDRQERRVIVCWRKKVINRMRKNGRKNGLGKRTDSLIPSTGHKKSSACQTGSKKEVVVEKVIKKEEVMVKITEVEPTGNSRVKISTRMLFWSWLIPSNSLVSFSRWLSRNRMITMRSSPESGDGEPQSWPALKEVPVIIKNYTAGESGDRADPRTFSRKT